MLKKAELQGNFGEKSCPNEKCTNYFKCGQERFHNDFRQEKRQVEDNMKTLKRDIKDLGAEMAMLESYQTNTNSCASVMRERLKKSNSSKYSKSSSLLKDIIILKNTTEMRYLLRKMMLKNVCVS